MTADDSDTASTTSKLDAGDSVKRPRGRPRKVPAQEAKGVEPTGNVVSAGHEEEKKPRAVKPVMSVPRDQPSEWVVPRRKEEEVAVAVPVTRAPSVKPMDEDTVVHASDEISDDEIRARREAARAVVAGIGRMKNEVQSMNSYIVTPPPAASSPAMASPPEDGNSPEDADQPLSRRDYWRQRRQERYLQRQQRRQVNGPAGAPPVPGPQTPARPQPGSGSAPDNQQRHNNRRDRQRPRQTPRFAPDHSEQRTPLGHDVPQQSSETLPPMNMSDLQGLSASVLLSMAAEQGIGETLASPAKQDVVFALLRHYVVRGGSIVGEGVLEICSEGHGFLRNRWNSFKSGPEDAMVPQQIIRKFGLRAGDKVVGATRPPSRDQRERRFVITDVSAVNGDDPSESIRTTVFESLVPTYPDRRIRLETSKDAIEMRVTNIFTPIGFGQRGLIIAPPRTGKTMLLQQMANAITKNHPSADLVLLLIDARPEEITEMERNTSAKVYASTFDEAPESHVQVAEVVMDMARRSVERGRDVVILLDSLTRLTRAYNALEPTSGKLLPGGIDVNALQKTKRFFGAARNIEGGGSLTVMASVRVETGSKMDEGIVEELKDTCNLELYLDRQLSEKRVYPAINIEKSATCKDERLLDPKELAKTELLRKALSGLQPVEAMEMVVERMKRVSSNAELLLTVKD